MQVKLPLVEKRKMTLPNLCVITIGNVSSALVLEIYRKLQFQVEVIEIPFIYAQDYEEWKLWNSTGREAFEGIGAGAAGCLLGHRIAWEKLSESSFEMAIILEADAQLTNYGKKYLATLINNVQSLDWNILHLGSHELMANVFATRNFMSLSPRVVAKYLWERIYLKTRSPRIKEMQFPYSTHAYLIKKDAAALLSRLEINFMVPVDVMLNSYSQVKGNKILRCRTPLIIQRSDQQSQTKRLGR